METPRSSRPSRSPAAPSPRPNARLGTLRRKLQEIVIAYVECAQHWDEVVSSGSVIVNRLAARKVDLLRESVVKEEKAEGAVGPFSKTLQELCEVLLELVKQLEEISGKVKESFLQLENLVELSRMQRSQSRSQETDALELLTWTSEELLHYAKLLEQDFQMELAVKQHVVDRVALSKEEDQVAEYVAMWELQPYLNCSSKLHLMFMRLETGVLK